ncbi:MAG TPA: hypothetical protein VMA74_07920 [Dyella sp.]|uniref:hypothetical protein n=1 Tax=Dyella sp. TaxID=1869338 RepID=UPI002C5ABA39|nr:hypothetical protein [Dyella sp.]HUB89644.1 hypothetical protein [Dyella sp.]
MRSKMLTVAIAAGLGLTSVTAPVSAQTSHKKVTVSAAELDQMKAEIQALEQKVQDLESQQQAQQQAQAETAQAVQTTQSQIQATQKQVVAAATEHKGDIFGGSGGVKWTFGGFLAAESIYRSRDTADDVASKYSSVPFPATSANAKNSQFTYSSRQSRLSIKAQGDINDDTHVTGYYEMDFLGGAQTANMNESNSFNPRVRHLFTNVDWDTYGLHALAGQTWSLLTLNGKGISPDTNVTPLSIDAQYVPGFTWARQTQLRIVKDWDKMWWLGVSVENPQTAGVAGVKGTGYYSSTTVTIPAGANYASGNTVSLNDRPDVIVKFAADPGWGHYEVFGLSREFDSRVSFTGVATPTNKTTSGEGFGFGMVLPLVPKTLEFQFSGMSGKGIGRYGTAGLNDVAVSPNGSLYALKENMLLGSVVWHPTSAWDVYLSGGREQQDTYLTTGANGKPYGYGSAILGYINTECSIYGAASDCSGQTRQIGQETLGFWWSFYQGKFGKVRFGAQYSHTTRQLYTDSFGNAPKASDNMFFTSIRYYPF